MTTGYSLWDSQVWIFFIALAVLFLAMLVANMLIRLIKPLRRLLIPAPVLGGFMLLGFLYLWDLLAAEPLISASTMELLTYHCLGLGCAALAMKSSAKEKSKRAQREIFNSSLITTSSYLLQAVVGLAISFGLSFFMNCWPASGMLVPLGYGQGPGQAYNWGHTYEMSWGFENGTSFGLTVAAMGFVACSIGGVIYLNVMRRKGIESACKADSEDVIEELTLEDVSGPNDIPLSGSIDKLSVQFGLTFLAYLAAFGLTSVLSWLCEISGVDLLTSTVIPLLWGFNFIFATLAGIGVRALLGVGKKKGFVKKEYLNNMMLDRVSGLMFDVMIVAAIGAINLAAFKEPSFIVPMLVMCVVAGVATYYYVNHTCKKLFPTYNDESFLALYGMLTGVVGTGIILLREIDPGFKTPACKNLIFQTLWTCLMGFPLLLLMGFVARSTTWTIITLAILVVMLVFFYIIIRVVSRKVAREFSESTSE